MNARKAVYAASLDPITNGHINVIERMAPLYDELVVVVAVAAGKTYTFTPEERVEMAKAAVSHLSNVTVDVCIGRYVVKFAESIGAHVVIRGLRNFKDLEDEQTLAEENRKIAPSVETLWLPCLPELMHVSSSMVKGHVGVDPSWAEQVTRSVPPGVAAKLKEKYIVGRARKHWDRLMKVLGNPEHSEEVFRDLVARYNKPHRTYHNLEHIVSMLDEAEFASGGPQTFVLAIWFHDIVYQTRAQNNEEASAEVAKLTAQHLGLSETVAQWIPELIIATKHTDAPTSYAAQLLVDLDLAILGKSQEEFDAYERAIREEYAWVPEADFRAGRAKILQSFLDRPSIFYTEFFREKYESTARANLARSIKRLNS